MYLEDVLQGHQLMFDSLTGQNVEAVPQHKVIGFYRNSKNRKYYVIECQICKTDTELNGAGIFRQEPSKLGKSICCRCALSTAKTESEWQFLCKRKCNEIGIEFKGFAGEFKGVNTKCVLSCVKHGEWVNYNINSLVNLGAGCGKCRYIEEDLQIQGFYDAYNYPEGTTFSKSDRKSKQGASSYWRVVCGDCEQPYDSTVERIKRGSLGCSCSYNNPKYSYLSGIYDNELLIAVKFGVTKHPDNRNYMQNRKTCYNIKLLYSWSFQKSDDCRSAERICKQELTCGIIPRTDMPDGFTETTYIYNIDYIKKAFVTHGGVEVFSLNTFEASR